MYIPDYTLVVAVDAKHLEQLRYTYPTWIRHKPSLLDHPMLVLFDCGQITADDVRSAISHPSLTITKGLTDRITYEGGTDKWNNAQRYKMLAGIVHAAAEEVATTYWLKLDTDVVATSMNSWIDPMWFVPTTHFLPVIIAHPWTYTKPPDQIDQLDDWADRAGIGGSRLNLHPEPGADRVGHKRIISWCGFFGTDFTRRCSEMATKTHGVGKLPVPSQDGYMWYMAKRHGFPIRCANMKARGWQQWSTMNNIRVHAERAMKSNGQ